MATFYNQPAAHRFGTALLHSIQTDRWHTLEIGVAWVRRSGLRHIRPAITDFLQRGGVFRVSVGLDFENTSAEGLQDLLELRRHGRLEPYVCFNEAQTVFHPKVYLFQNTRTAKLIVGSNNLTEAGLFANTEAGLEVELPINDPVIVDARAALASWRDTTRRLALQLDDALLRDLVARNYVFSEEQLSRQRRAQAEARRQVGAGQGGTGRREALFGRAPVTIPRPPGAPAPPRAQQGRAVREPRPREGQGVGRVLLMRVRKASITERPTQTQIPIRVLNEPFFQGITEITSAHDGRKHGIQEARARGSVNTLKLEIPEMADFADPVVRFERTEDEIVYEAYDADSVLGRPIHAALLRGMDMSPRETLQTIGDRERATWWRFI